MYSYFEKSVSLISFSVWIALEIMIFIFSRLMDNNEDYNFESLSGASNLEEVLYDVENVSFRRTLARLSLVRILSERSYKLNC